MLCLRKLTCSSLQKYLGVCFTPMFICISWQEMTQIVQMYLRSVFSLTVCVSLSGDLSTYLATCLCRFLCHLIVLICLLDPAWFLLIPEQGPLSAALAYFALCICAATCCFFPFETAAVSANFPLHRVRRADSVT